MEPTCKQCFSQHQNVSNSPATFRPEAITGYVRLQQQGFQPVMCEDSLGHYRVCHATQAKAA